MKRLALVMLLLAGGASAGEPATAVSAAGVVLEARVEAPGRLLITLDPPAGALLSGTLGVAYAPLADGSAWLDGLPGTVTAGSEYFDGPVRGTIAFSRQRLAGTAALGVTFGACLLDQGVCVLEEAMVSLEAADDGTVDIAVAMRDP